MELPANGVINVGLTRTLTRPTFRKGRGIGPLFHNIEENGDGFLARSLIQKGDSDEHLPRTRGYMF